MFQNICRVPFFGGTNYLNVEKKMLVIPSLAYFKPLLKRTDDASFISFKGLGIVLLNLLLYKGGLDLSRRALETRR
jgi:hypothetical protein